MDLGNVVTGQGNEDDVVGDVAETQTVEVASPLPVDGHAAGPMNDTKVVLFVIVALALVILSVIVGNVVAIAAYGPEASLPESLNTIGATAVGALGAMLASTASNRSQPR